MIRQVDPSDANAIRDIYNYHVHHTIVTFEEEPISEGEMKTRINSVTAKFPWLVCVENDAVVGYAYASEWRGRSAYRFSAESTIYLHKEFTGKGIGSKLYKSLIDEIQQKKLHSLIGGISLPNSASVALHEKLGFKKVAQFSEVGFKLNQWIDVGYWQLMLSR